MIALAESASIKSRPAAAIAHDSKSNKPIIFMIKVNSRETSQRILIAELVQSFPGN